MKLALVTLTFLSLGNAQAKEPGVGQSWRALAAADSAAALKLIEENHPGAAPELGDKEFLALLARARQHVAERLPKVSTYGGYSALMNGLAADFEDGHIWTNQLADWQVRTWAGIVPVRRGGKWLVGLHERAPGEPDVAHAEIVDCDGEPFDGWARKRIALFGGDARIDAVLAKRAPTLLLDDANPFLARPAACSFRTVAGDTQRLALQWRLVLHTSLSEKIAKAQPRAVAQMGVSAFEGGYWIGLPNLSPAAAAVVKAVREQQDALRAAPMVVIDLRGNGGGDSAYAFELAQLLQGEARAAELGTEQASCSGDYWRASRDNLPYVQAARERAAKRGDKESADWFDGIAKEMASALAAHKPFAPALPACAAQSGHETTSKPVPASIVPAMKGKLVLVTNRACFSSCLLATDYFRRLGALHVGEATDVSTRFMDLREITLPSGIRTFTVLQKVSLGSADFGPYVPEIAYPGDLSDDQALKEWVAALGKR